MTKEKGRPKNGRSFVLHEAEETGVPYKAVKPCAHHGCSNLTRGRYCEKHAKQEAKRYNQYDRAPDSGKRYGRAWERIRAVFLSAYPLCQLCKQDGRLTPATLVHHKVKITDGGKTTGIICRPYVLNVTVGFIPSKAITFSVCVFSGNPPAL